MNFLKLKAANAAELKNARETGRPDPVPLSLNEYGDYSARDYQAAAQSTSPLSQQENTESNTDVQSENSQNEEATSAYFTAGSPTDQDRWIKEIYKKWCFDNGKMYDEARLDTFALNLKVVEEFSKKTGKKAEMNQYADLSPEEYKAAMMARQKEEGNANPMAPEENQPSPQGAAVRQATREDSELERIRNEYRSWCQQYGREYQESRLTT
ncbi:MAG: hypothetical protein SGARI_005017, partial [Bacillariaceae sp.]